VYLTHLIELDVEENDLSSLPDSLVNLVNLKNLYIDNNNDLLRPDIPSLEFCDVG
jgi:hypothetical protein